MKPTLRILLLVAGLAVVSQAQISSFQHIVVVVQENRTPDNLFYALCATNPCSTMIVDSTHYDIQTANGQTDPPAPAFTHQSQQRSTMVTI